MAIDLPDPAEDALARARAEALAFRKEVIDKIATLVTAAFGLVAALAWNTAIQTAFKRYYTGPGEPLREQLAYAMVVTVVAVVITVWVGRVAGRLAGAREKESKGKAT